MTRAVDPVPSVQPMEPPRVRFSCLIPGTRSARLCPPLVPPVSERERCVLLLGSNGKPRLNLLRTVNWSESYQELAPAVLNSTVFQAGFNRGSIPVAEPAGLASVALAPRQHFGPVFEAGGVGTRESQIVPRTTPRGMVGLPSLVCMILMPREPA